MINGGYKVVDFENINISSTDGATVPGIYSSIEETDKVIMISGVVIDNVDQKSAYVIPVVNGDSFTFSSYGKAFTVTNEDKVTIE